MNEMSSLVQVCCEPDYDQDSRMHPLTYHLSWRVLVFLDPLSISQFAPLTRDLAEISEPIANTLLIFAKFHLEGYSSEALCLRVIEEDPFFPFLGIVWERHETTETTANEIEREILHF